MTVPNGYGLVIYVGAPVTLALVGVLAAWLRSRALRRADHSSKRSPDDLL